MTAAQKLRAAREGIALFNSAETPEKAIEAFTRVAADLRSASEKMGAEAKTRVRGTSHARAKIEAVEAWIKSRHSPGDLLDWVRTVRNDGLHATGRGNGPRLVVRGGLHVESLEIGALGEGLLTFGADGVRFHRDVGTPEESSEPYAGGSWQAGWQLVIENPPTTLRGEEITVSSAREALDLAYATVRADWDEAEQFGR